METLLFFIILIPLVKGVCMALKPRKRRKAYQARPAAENKITDNLNALTALQQQRDIYNDLISEIDCMLDNVPPNREKLLKDKAMIYSKLAIVESKIYKLMN